MRNFIPCFALFRTLLERSDHYVMEHAQRFQVDESHNHLHSRQVLYYTKEILQQRPPIKPYDMVMASLGAVLHDVPDSKYIPHHQNTPVLRHAIETILPWSLHSTLGADLETMIPHLSFSKTVQKRGDRLHYTLPEAMKNFAHLDTYHVIRQADLLSSYHTKRTLLYRMHKNQYKISKEDALEEARDLFRDRMALLRPSGMFDEDIDHHLAKPLEKKALERWDTIPSSFPTWEAMLDHFEMDPEESWEKTVDDLEFFLKKNMGTVNL